MIGRTNSGAGGANIVGSNAVPLRVTAPDGTTSVTASKDGVTVRASFSDGVWVFSGLSVGTWTISVDVNGTTKNVDYVVSVPEFGVALELTLYDNGEIADTSGGFSVETYSGDAPQQSIYAGVTNIRSYGASSGAYLTNDVIEISGFRTLQYKCGMGGNGSVRVVIMPADASSIDDAVASKDVTSFSTAPTDLEDMDISGVSGKYRVGVAFRGTTGTLNCYVAYLHLE